MKSLKDLTKLEARRYLRRGDGIMTMPACRRRERLFGQIANTGRMTRPLLGVKIEKLFEVATDGPEIDDDTCLEAYIRLVAGHAHADAEAAGVAMNE